MWFTRDDQGYRAWFTVVDKNGLIRTGGVPGDFTVTVVNPADTASTTPAVAESATKPGLYTFLVPSTFFATHGVGGYGVVVEVIMLTSPKVEAVFGEVLRVFDEDFDSVATTVQNIESIVSRVVSATVLENTVIAAATNAQNFQITVVGLTAGFYDLHFIQVSDGTRFALALIETIDASGNIVTSLPLPFTPGIGATVQVLGQLNVGGGRAG